jgi:hypothetical protein
MVSMVVVETAERQVQKKDRRQTDEYERLTPAMNEYDKTQLLFAFALSIWI